MAGQTIADEVFQEAHRDAAVKCEAWRGRVDPALVHVVGRNLAIDRLRKQRHHDEYIRGYAEPLIHLKRRVKQNPTRRIQILEFLVAVDTRVELLTGFPSPVLTIVSRIVAGEVPGKPRKTYLTYNDVADLLGITPRQAREIRVAMYQAYEELQQEYL